QNFSSGRHFYIFNRRITSVAQRVRPRVRAIVRARTTDGRVGSQCGSARAMLLAAHMRRLAPFLLALAVVLLARGAATVDASCRPAPTFLRSVGGRLFFGTFDDSGPGWALWTAAPGDADATLLHDGLGADLELASLGTTLYFGTDAGLWRSDGTAGGTTRVATPPFFPSALKSVGGVLFFSQGD